MGALVFVYGVICYAVFFGTFLYLIGFLGNFAVPKTIDSGSEGPVALALAVNLALIALFGLQHSVMARPGFKRWWKRLVPASAERSTYVLLSSLVLMLLYWQWRPMTQVIWQAEAQWAQAVLWAVFGAGILLVLLSTFVIDHFDLFGLRQVFLRLINRPYTEPPFKVTYFYKFMRHPLYVGWFLTFWGTPHMTLGHLLFAVGMSGYILIAVPYEERDLAHFLGEDYRRYQERVPKFVPRFGRVHETVKGKGAPAASN